MKKMNEDQEKVDLRSVNTDPLYKRLASSTKNTLHKLFIHNNHKARAKDGKFVKGSGGLQQLSRLRWGRIVPLILLVGFVGGTWVYQSRAQVYGVDIQAEAVQFFGINSSRHARRTPSLYKKSCLDKVARDWSRNMARQNKMYHNDNRSRDIQAACGYWRYMAIAENVGYGHDSVNLFQSFMNSPLHKANILNSKYKELGVGSWRTSTGRVYITHIFVYVYPQN